MNIRQILTTTAIIGAGLIGTAVLTQGIRSAHAQDGPGAEGWSQGHRRHGGGLMKLCKGGDMDANLNRISERLETELALSNEQTQNLDAIAQAIKSSGLQEACANEDEVPPANVLEKLDRMESRMETGLSMMRQIRPSFETFYISLSSEQQEDLEALMARRRHRR
ncbi:MAG: Spy/CpxP family protein refolding chaperone [Cyanobacteria bacterium P01_F01_bin.150]